MHGSVTATHESHDLDDEGSNPSSEQFTVTSIFYWWLVTANCSLKRLDSLIGRAADS
jgi:hypothetical protein